MIRSIIVGVMAGTVAIPVAVGGAYAIGVGTVGLAKRLSRALAFGNSTVSRRNAAQTPPLCRSAPARRGIDGVTPHARRQRRHV
jgi:hypothetical protein